MRDAIHMHLEGIQEDGEGAAGEPGLRGEPATLIRLIFVCHDEEA
jgi:hypothetical protein